MEAAVIIELGEVTLRTSDYGEVEIVDKSGRSVHIRIELFLMLAKMLEPGYTVKR